MTSRASGRTFAAGGILLAGACLIFTPMAAAAQPSGANRLGVIVGQWLGADFREASLIAEDAFGPAEFGSALQQGNSPMVGIQFTGFFSDWFGAEVAVAYASNTWTTVSGRVVGGSISGDTTDVSGVTTVPMNLNALVRPRLTSAGPHPFVSAGLGGVVYDIDRAEAPLVIPPSVGPPVDTLLFDLKLGWRLAPNAAVGLMYEIADRVDLRAEGRMWFTVIEDVLNDEFFVQRNKWISLSASWIF